MGPERLPADAAAPSWPSPADGPWWRALLETRWRARLQDVTELSLAYHEAAALVPGPRGRGSSGPAAGTVGRKPEQLLRRAVAARRALADTEEALARLAAGQFGRCEHCAGTITAGVLAVTPEARYCRRCAVGPAPGNPPGRVSSGRF